MRTHHFWTREEEDILREIYNNYTREELAIILNVSPNAIKRKAYDLRIKKSPAALSKICKRPNRGQFSKGHLPHNTAEDGIIKIRMSKYKSGENKPYKWIRLTLGKWEQLHVYNWKKVHGKVPKGMAVVFKDGNSMNCEVENLELISLEENMRRNSIHNYPVEIVASIRKLQTLKRKIKNHEKQVIRP